MCCCNYFKWLCEENDDEKDAIIAKQRRKIYDVEKSLRVYKKKDPIVSRSGLNCWCNEHCNDLYVSTLMC